jgi:putative transposase
MPKSSPFLYFKTSFEIIRLAVMLYIRFPLSLQNVEDLLHERCVDVSHEKIRCWWHQFGPMFTAEVRKWRIRGMRSSPGWWHLDAAFVKINVERHYLWRPADHEGEVLKSFVTKRRDRKDAVKLLRKTMKRMARLRCLSPTS